MKTKEVTMETPNVTTEITQPKLNTTEELITTQSFQITKLVSTTTKKTTTEKSEAHGQSIKIQLYIKLYFLIAKSYYYKYKAY